MAIKRRLRSKVLHVWSQDSALDKSDPQKLETALKKFEDSGDLEDLAPVILPHDKPTVFELYTLKRPIMIQLDSMASGGAADNTAVAFGLRGVQNFTVDGKPYDLELVDAPAAIGGKCVSERSLDQLYDPGLFAELGARLVRASRLDP